MINNDIFPIGKRAKYGRICKECWNANDHLWEMTNEETNRQKITCPECGHETEKDHTQFKGETIDGKMFIEGKEVELKTNKKGHVWIDLLGS